MPGLDNNSSTIDSSHPHVALPIADNENAPEKGYNRDLQDRL